MTPTPFIDREPVANLEWCQDCGQHYWTDYGHDCPVSPQSSPVELAVTLLAIGGILGVLAWLIARAVA